MAGCPHGHPRRCEVCRMEELVDYHGVPEDHIDDDPDADGGAD